MSGFAVQGLPGQTLTLRATTTSPTTQISDSYSFEAGRAGSLRRVTNVIQ